MHGRPVRRQTKLSVANNIIDLDHHEASAREAGRIVRYNRTGACFGINPNYTENNNLMDFVITITGASAITGIGTAPSSDTLYDLSGRPVPAAATLSRGIYIKNNRKQVVK